MTLIVDSGGVLAALDRRQEEYGVFREALEKASGPLIISPFVVAELDHLIFDRYGRRQQLFFLGEVERGAYRLERFSTQDIGCARALCTQYADLKGFGVADASNVVLAERYDAFDILTTDQRDFRVVAGSGDRRFRILPYDS